VPFFNSSRKSETLAEVIPRLAARPLTADPGEKFVYGLNTDVVGYLVEVLSGKPWMYLCRSGFSGRWA
jgi:CubicO group peptidase (beta-lactamase class C family)